MTLAERLRMLASALPSDDSAVTLTRSDLLALVDGAEHSPSLPTRDLTVEDVADETGRAASTVRGWLIDGKLRGYKLNDRDWRIPWAALREYLDGQGRDGGPEMERLAPGEKVDITEWRKVREVGG